MALSMSIFLGLSPNAHIRRSWAGKSPTRPCCSTTFIQTHGGASRYGAHQFQRSTNVFSSPRRLLQEGLCPSAVLHTSDADNQDSHSDESKADVHPSSPHHPSSDYTSPPQSSSAPPTHATTLSPTTPSQTDSPSPYDWVPLSEGESYTEFDTRASPLPAPHPPHLPALLPAAHSSGIVFLASLGALGTAYLTFQKVTGGSVACQVGGSCGSVLDSPWGTLLGLPLSLYGCVAYGLTAILALRPSKWPLLASTSILSATSAYLLFILTTQLSSTFCLYCFSSAALSLSLLLLAYQGLTEEEVKTALLPQAGLATAVILGLSVAFGDVSEGGIDLPPVEAAVTTVSPAPVLSLAKHLQAVGAKMYGAFWCSHCYEQKQMFGQQAMEYVGYVECYPEGYRSGVQIASACKEANIEGFPTWIVKGKVLSGEQGLDQLAEASGFDMSSLGVE